MKWTCVKEVIAAQDRGLDDLAAIIRRQRDIGIVIGNEVDEQNGNNDIFAIHVILSFDI